MQQVVQRGRPGQTSAGQISSQRLSWPRFFLRYPIFLLAFGPPLFRAADKYAGVDTSKAHFDIWTILQLGLIGLVSSRALLRLANSRIIRLTAPVRSVVKYWLFLGLMFVVSIAYSPGRAVSFAYSVIYFLILTSITEFLVDTYRTPPDWMQCLFALRLVSLLLFLAVLVTLPISPGMVLEGFRLLGGSVASVPLIAPVIAIVSAYSFLHSLEPRLQAALLTLLGIAGTAVTQWRGAEIGLIVIFLILGLVWARESLRSAYKLVGASVALSLVVILVLLTVGAGRVWNRFNRGGDFQNIVTISGRTELWSEVIAYCSVHPQGMGYIAGIRSSRISSGGSTSFHSSLTHMGGTDNSYFEVLADAGWIALLLYLVILFKIIALGMRFALEHSRRRPRSELIHRRPIQCALLIFGFCLIDGMDSSIFATPLTQAYYFQHIAMAVILGTASSIILARRRSSAHLPNQLGKQNHLPRQNNLSNS